MSPLLPPVLQSAIGALNAGNEDAFVAAFSPLGVVDDWGRIVRGADGVRPWTCSTRSHAIGLFGIGLFAEPDAAIELMADIRKCEAERLEIETVNGIYAGRDLVHGNAPGKGRLPHPEASS